MARSPTESGWLAEAVSLAMVLLLSPARAAVADSESPVPSDTRSAEEVVQRHDVAVGANGLRSPGSRQFEGTYRAEFRERRGLGPGTFEIYAQAPDRWVVLWSDPGPGGVAGEGFKQGSGWTATWAGVQRTGYQVTLAEAATGRPIDDGRFGPPTTAAACCAAKK